MSMTMNLTYSGTDFTFSPCEGYAIPQHREREQYNSINGDLNISEVYEQSLYEIPLIAISKADYDNIYTWWDSMLKLTFMPDTSVPGTTITVRIINLDNPLRMMHGMAWAGFYEGTLQLHEVPALS